MKNYPLYEHTLLPTLKELLSFCAEKYGDKPAFQYSDRKEVISKDYIQFKSEVEALGTYLFNQGYRNSHIAVFGENSYEWILTHFAVTCGGNVIVPIDKELHAEEIAVLPEYYLSKNEAKERGWKAHLGNLSEILPGMMIGGDVYQNRNGHLPQAEGRIWYEADINYVDGFRTRHRILYSNDGLVFVTYDHYETFHEII